MKKNIIKILSYSAILFVVAVVGLILSGASKINTSYAATGSVQGYTFNKTTATGLPVTISFSRGAISKTTEAPNYSYTSGEITEGDVTVSVAIPEGYTSSESCLSQMGPDDLFSSTCQANTGWTPGNSRSISIFAGVGNSVRLRWRFTPTVPPVSTNSGSTVISGTVTDQNNNPLSDVAVQVYDSKGALVNQVFTNSGGSYITATLTPSVYRIVPVKAGIGYASENQPILGYRFSPSEKYLLINATEVPPSSNFKANQTEIASRVNLVKNGTFEERLGNNPNNPNHYFWSAGGWGTLGVTSPPVADVILDNGNHVAVLVDSAKRSVLNNQGVPITTNFRVSQTAYNVVAGGTYRFTMKIKTENLVNSDAYAVVAWGGYNSSAENATSLKLGNISGTKDWFTYASPILTAPPIVRQAEVILSLKPRVVGPGDKDGKAYFDDIKLYRIEQFPNFIENGTLEEKSGNSFTPYWKDWKGVGFSVVSGIPGNDGRVVIFADSAMQNAGGGVTTNSMASQSLTKLVPGAAYRFSMKIKTENLVNYDAYATLTWWGVNSGAVFQDGNIKLGVTSGTHDWFTYTSPVLIAPANLAEIGMTLHPRVKGYRDKDGKAYFDDLRFWQVEQGSGTQINSTPTPTPTGGSYTPTPTPILSPTPVPGASFSDGDKIYLFNGPRYSRVTPSNTQEAVIRAIIVETTGTIVGDSVTTLGYTWWHIIWNDEFHTDGWTAERDGSNIYLKKVVASPTPTPTPVPGQVGQFQNGDSVRVAVSILKVRTDAGTSNPTVTGSPKLQNATGTVIGGPKDAGIYTWWKIDWGNGVIGWSAEGSSETEPYLVKVDSGAKFQNGDRVQVKSTKLNVRSAAGTSNPTVQGSPMLKDATGTIKGGPTDSGFFTWWQIQWDNGVTGWSAEGSSETEPYLEKLQ